MKEATEDIHKDDKNKSLLIALAIYGIIILILFFIRFWPPYGQSEKLIAEGGGGGGMEVNFGDSDLGKGNDFQNENLEVKTKVSVAAVSQPQEDILAQDEVGENINMPAKPINKPKEKIKVEKPIEKPVVNDAPVQPVKKTNSALSNMIKGNKSGGDGDDNAGGNKGKLNGNLNSEGYYGSGGSGGGRGGGTGTGDGTGTGPGSGSGSGGGRGNGGTGGTNYSLAGRRTIIRPDVDNSCNSFGRVVIEITVDQSGNTISVTNGRGTNADACLINLAKTYAKRTKWTASEAAAEKQTGTIVYNFTNN